MDLPSNDSLGVALAQALHTGDLATLQRLLAENPGIATARIVATSATTEARSLLHVATDWPGHFPNVASSVRLLVSAGADVNARFVGRHSETALHWAASSDDIDALDALLDSGADVEALGSIIGGGTPVADAVAFGQWNAARRLVERGARTTLWQSAALGLMDRIRESFAGSQGVGADEITNAFWCACHGGQQVAAEFLFGRGADVNWIGYDGLTPIDAARRSGAEPLALWLREQGAESARDPS